MGFDPVTITAGMAAAGLVAGLFGANDQAEAQQVAAQAKAQQLQAAAAAAAYQGQVATNNAAIARGDKTYITQAGEVATTNQGLKTRAAVGAEKARQGAAGIDVNSGSAVDTRAGTTEIGMLDALTTRSNFAKQAYAKEVEATSDTAQAGLFKMEHDSDLQGVPLALEGGDLASEGTLLSAASSVGTNWSKFQTAFGPSPSPATG